MQNVLQGMCETRRDKSRIDVVHHSIHGECMMQSSHEKLAVQGQYGDKVCGELVLISRGW